jgi:hypothetical protein
VKPGGIDRHSRALVLQQPAFVLVPSDGGCRTDDATVTRREGWLEQGLKTNKEAEQKAGA